MWGRIRLTKSNTMEKIKIRSFHPFLRFFLLLGFAALIQNIKAQSQENSSNEKLFDELIYKDSLLFDAALNTCNMKQIEALLTKDFEFYPDKG